MLRRDFGMWLGASAALVIVTPARMAAHHSTSMYDMENPVTVTGTVKRFEWTNPHAFLFVEVKDKDGQVEEWEIEMMSLNHLRSYGWLRDTVKPGDVISCTGGRARSGVNSMISSLIKLPDGRSIRS
jgi:DNA/RNA endonuclease YhcR with UshA esterase domain